SRFGHTASLRTETAAALWEQLDLLHEAGIVHGSLDGAHLGWTDAGDPCFVSLAGASTDSTRFRVMADRAQLLCFTATRTNPSLAVEVAQRHLGTESLVA